MRLIVILTYLINLLSLKADIVDDLKRGFDYFKEGLENACLTNEQCLKKFWVNNYCCEFKCCNVFQYLFRDE